MKKKGIFGGTFDPIHNGHLHIAYEALYRLNLDKIIFMPSGNPPHKILQNVTNASVRYDMIKRAIKGEERFTVSDYEIKKSTLSYTYKTLQRLNKIEPNVSWYFIVGIDCLMELEQWKNVNIIFNNCNFVVFSRPGYSYKEVILQKEKIEKKYNKDVILLDIPLLDISSTNIRKKIKEGKNVSYLLPYSVFNFIKQLNLYN